MKKRNWTGREKLEIMLEGLKGETTLTECCNRHQIPQGQFCEWRDRLMEEGAKLFARGGVDKEAERLKAENRRLTQAVGELAMELKKRLVSRRARSFEADKAILPKIEELKREHPAWGYRRVWAWLRRCEGLKINHSGSCAS